jgi:hypothetical protein
MTTPPVPPGPSGPSGPLLPHPGEDALVELALGVSTDPAAVSGHLRDCADCRATYDDLSRDLEVALAAGPTIEPPAGFESRVLARLRAEATTPPGRRSRGVVLLAAAAMVGLVVGVLGLLGVQAVTDDPPPRDVVALQTDDGRVVGRVLSSWVDDEEVLVVLITDGPPGVRYICRLRLDDDTTAPAGEWVVPESGTATWITPSDPHAASIELVTDSGKVWSTASLG